MRKHYIFINNDGTYELTETDATVVPNSWREITELQFKAIAVFNETNEFQINKCRIDPIALIPFLV